MAMWLLVAAAVCLLLVAAVYFFRIRTVASFRRRADRERPDKANSEFEPASVIVYSQGDADNLTELLGSLLNQDYPAAYEVIVVNEGESADVRDAISMLRPHHPNLYLTFTPEGVYNLSRKKLAITLGIKAARYDVVVLTTSAAIIGSRLWLRRMMAPFGANSPVEVVLGYAYAAPDEDTARGKRRRSFDAIAESARWLGVAIAGKPFRGTEYNLAYRKKAFLDNKGFARSLNLHYGDDDIFISQIAHGGNTAVELSEDSLVRVREGNNPRLFNERSLRRSFTERRIRRRPRILFGLTGWLQLAVLALCIGAGIVAWPNVESAIIGLVIVVLMFVLQIATWRSMLKALKGRRLAATIPWLTLTHPLRRLECQLASRLGKHKKYTWE